MSAFRVYCIANFRLVFAILPSSKDGTTRKIRRVLLNLKLISVLLMVYFHALFFKERHVRFVLSILMRLKCHSM